MSTTAPPVCVCTRWDLARLPGRPDGHRWHPDDGKCPDEPVQCCPGLYLCPGSAAAECLDHGGFDVCCDHPRCPGNPHRQR